MSTVAAPDDPVEANLLLEKAICHCKVQYIQKNLADQVVRRDALQLQYSRLQVEKAKSKITAAELDVGRVHMVVRRCGYSPDLLSCVSYANM